MEYRRFGDKYIVRLERGDEIIESIKKLAIEEKIRLGRVTGIGAVNRAKFGLFKMEEKEYYSKEFEGDMEIINLSGNISEMNGEVYIHLHIALGDDSLRVIRTFKLCLYKRYRRNNHRPYRRQSRQKYSDEIGINLLDLNK